MQSCWLGTATHQSTTRNVGGGGFCCLPLLARIGWIKANHPATAMWDSGRMWMGVENASGMVGKDMSRSWWNNMKQWWNSDETWWNCVLRCLCRTIGISAIPGEKPGEKTDLSACNVTAATREMLDTVASITTQRRPGENCCAVGNLRKIYQDSKTQHTPSKVFRDLSRWTCLCLREFLLVVWTCLVCGNVCLPL